MRAAASFYPDWRGRWRMERWLFVGERLLARNGATTGARDRKTWCFDRVPGSAERRVTRRIQTAGECSGAIPPYMVAPLNFMGSIAERIGGRMSLWSHPDLTVASGAPS